MNESSINYFSNLEAIVALALEEDLGKNNDASGDITAQLIPAGKEAKANIITRETAIVCGRPWFDEVFRQLDSSINIEWLVKEGQVVEPNTELLRLAGNTRILLTGERTALNFLQTLMGTATTASQYAQLLNGTSTKILDTRKTLPGLRLAQKYAVNIGGCGNHRMGLYDAFLIKENHITTCGSIDQAVKQARKLSPQLVLEVEVENIQELKAALAAKADVIMLDNFDEKMVVEALTLKTDDVLYEISGNLDLQSINTQQFNGIDRISIGALTKHCKATDLSMRVFN